MSQTGFREHLCDPSRFVKVCFRRFSRLDIAESAGAGACVAKHHDGGGAPGPAVTDIWARCFLAHRMKPELFKFVSQLDIRIAARHLSADPIGLSADRQRAGSIIIEDHPAEIDNRFVVGSSRSIAAKRAWMPRR